MPLHTPLCPDPPTPLHANMQHFPSKYGHAAPLGTLAKTKPVLPAHAARPGNTHLAAGHCPGRNCPLVNCRLRPSRGRAGSSQHDDCPLRL